MTNTTKLVLNLQLFTDGGNAGEGTAQGTQTAEGGLANQNTDVANLEADFDNLIKGQYKDIYNKKVQNTVKERLKGSKETIDRYNALSPTLQLLADRYGVDVTDHESLINAIENDNAYYEEEALERGVTVEQLKEIKKLERENKAFREQMREKSVKENADKQYAQWMQESEALKETYPNFDLNAELQNKTFTDLIMNNIDIKTAYEVLHKDDIIQSAMNYTANAVEQKIANNIIANGSRPAESGVMQNSATLTKSDVSKLTKAQREELAQRASMGERITFS